MIESIFNFLIQMGDSAFWVMVLTFLFAPAFWALINILRYGAESLRAANWIELFKNSIFIVAAGITNHFLPDENHRIIGMIAIAANTMLVWHSGIWTLICDDLRYYLTNNNGMVRNDIRMVEAILVDSRPSTNDVTWTADIAEWPKLLPKNDNKKHLE